VKAFLAQHPRIHLHFTPTSESWLNAVEGWFSQVERRSIRSGIFTSVQALRAEQRRGLVMRASRRACTEVSAAATLQQTARLRRARVRAQSFSFHRTGNVHVNATELNKRVSPVWSRGLPRTRAAHLRLILAREALRPLTSRLGSLASTEERILSWPASVISMRQGD
jgi:hypothetical protein